MIEKKDINALLSQFIGFISQLVDLLLSGITNTLTLASNFKITQPWKRKNVINAVMLVSF